MSFLFHPEAEIEFNEAISYYEEIEHGLGYDFAIEIYACIKRCESFPKAWPLIATDIRRSLVRRFPYGVLYSQTKDGIYILAIMNLHCLPGYWKDRK